MRLKKPECKHCSGTAKVKLYWCTRNLLKMPMKTYYCAHCAKIVVPGRDWIREGASA
jgi:hypothetical protein